MRHIEENGVTAITAYPYSASAGVAVSFVNYPGYLLICDVCKSNYTKGYMSNS